MNIDSLTTIIAKAYPHDQTAPGVTVAYLRAERKFYASIVRYADPRTPKQVVQRAHGRSALEAIDNLYRAWSNRDARDELGEHNTRFSDFGCNSDVYDQGSGDQSPPPPMSSKPARDVSRDMFEENPQPSSVEVLASLQDRVSNLRKHVSQLEGTHKDLNELLLQIAKRNHEERDVRLRERLAGIALRSVLTDKKVVAHDAFEMERVAHAAVGYADAVIERLRTK